MRKKIVLKLVLPRKLIQNPKIPHHSFVMILGGEASVCEVAVDFAPFV